MPGAVFGEAGTIFLDKKLFEELERSRISASTVDRYTSVVMGGIASEGAVRRGVLVVRHHEGNARKRGRLLCLFGHDITPMIRLDWSDSIHHHPSIHLPPQPSRSRTPRGVVRMSKASSSSSA